MNDERILTYQRFAPDLDADAGRGSEMREREAMPPGPAVPAVRGYWKWGGKLCETAMQGSETG